MFLTTLGLGLAWAVSAGPASRLDADCYQAPRHDNRIQIQSLYVTPNYETEVVVILADNDEGVSPPPASVTWDNPSGKLRISVGETGFVSVTPAEKDGYDIDMTVLTANVTTLEGDNFVLTTYPVIFRPGGEKLPEPERTTSFPLAASSKNSSSLADSPFGERIDMGTDDPCQDGRVTSLLWLDEIWAMGDSNEYWFPDVSLWGDCTPIEVVPTVFSSFGIGMDVTIYWPSIFNTQPSLVRYEFERRSCTTPGLQYSKAMWNKQWCDCTEEFYVAIINKFMSRVYEWNFVALDVSTFYSHWEFEDVPSVHIAWRFGYSGYIPQLRCNPDRNAPMEELLPLVDLPATPCDL